MALGDLPRWGLSNFFVESTLCLLRLLARME